MESNPSLNPSAMADKLPDAQTVDRAAQSAHQTIDRLASKATPAVERMRTAASSAAESLQMKADQWAEIEDRWLESTRSYVRENPLTAIGIALAAGMLLSRITR